MASLADVVVRGGNEGWRTLSVPGTSAKALRVDRASGSSTSLVRFEAGTNFPAHNHPGGEEIFLLEGDLRVGGHRLEPGDYLYTPPDGKHAAATERGCLFLVTLGKPVEFIERATS
jgi:anti-sigma factor ChrR (cupin superfamily)